MIYAIIIIAALAAVFVILIRRLPEAANQAEQPTSPAKPIDQMPAANPPTEKAEKKGFSFSLPAMPTIQLPQFPKAKSKPDSPTNPTEPTAPTAAPTSGSRFSLPNWRTLNPFHQSLTKPTKPASSKQPAADDFWEGIDEAAENEQPKTVKETVPLNKPEPRIAPKATPTVTPQQPEPTSLLKTAESKAATPLFTPFKSKKPKDIFQEAEDLFAIKDYQKAEKLFLRLATSDPKNPKIYSRLGVIYMEQSNFEDARDALQQAIKLEPNVASRHFNLALAYANLGSTAKAIDSMEAALKYDPGNRKYRKMLDELLANR